MHVDVSEVMLHIYTQALTETSHVFCQPADEKPDVSDLDNCAPIIGEK